MFQTTKQHDTALIVFLNEVHHYNHVNVIDLLTDSDKSLSLML